MHKQIVVFLAASVALIFASIYISYRINSGLVHELAIASFGTFLGVAAGLIIVNVFLDRRSRKIAAGPLIELIQSATRQFHNDLFVDLGRQTFGIAEFNRLIQLFQTNGRNPQAFLPAERDKLCEMISNRREDISNCASELDTKISDILPVLG